MVRQCWNVWDMINKDYIRIIRNITLTLFQQDIITYTQCRALQQNRLTPSAFATPSSVALTTTKSVGVSVNAECGKLLLGWKKVVGSTSMEQ